MDDTRKARAGWSDTEKLGFILQLVAKLQKIPWDELELPPGRTQKACQVMLDKEKQKVKKAGQTPDTTPASNKKRNAEDSTEKSVKKSRTRKSPIKKEVDADGVDMDSDELIKSEDE